jgi:putative transposase
MHWLWRAVDQEGYVLDEIVQAHCAKSAARLLRRSRVARQSASSLTSLGSYAASKRTIMPAVAHRSNRLNQRSNMPTLLHRPFNVTTSGLGQMG